LSIVVEKEDDPTLIFVGRIRHAKRLDHVMEDQLQINTAHLLGSGVSATPKGAYRKRRYVDVNANCPIPEVVFQFEN
jgi:hypothetical protein